MTFNILVTGGAGFIGSNLSNKLIAAGHKVRVLDKLEPQIHGIDPYKSELFLSLNSDIEFIQGDVRDRQLLGSALEGVDIVFHFVSETGTGQSMYELVRYTDTNVCGTSCLLELISEKKSTVSKLILSSSRAVYGEGKYDCALHGVVYPNKRSASQLKSFDFEMKCPHCFDPVKSIPTDENSRTNPTSIYGVTKLAQEMMVSNICGNLGISFTNLRFQNVYGPGQSLRNPYTGLLSVFSSRIMNSLPIHIFEDGLESRDFVYIDDIIQACLAVLLPDHHTDGKTYNIGTGLRTSIIDLSANLVKAFEKDIDRLITGEFRLGDIRHNSANIELAQSDLSFLPKTCLSDGLAKYVDWVKGNPLSNFDISLERSMQELKEKGF